MNLWLINNKLNDQIKLKKYKILNHGVIHVFFSQTELIFYKNSLNNTNKLKNWFARRLTEI